MNPELLIGLSGVLLAAPGALLHWRDLRAPRSDTVSSSFVATPAAVGHPLPPPSTGYSAPTSPSVGQVVGAGVPLSLPRRFLSALVDTYAAALIGAIGAGIALAEEPQASDDGSGAYGIGIVIGWLLISWVASRTGRSPGRLVVGGRLVPVDDAAGRVSFGKVLGRSLLALGLNSFFWLSLWFGLSSPERRTLHDRWTGTRVVRTR